MCTDLTPEIVQQALAGDLEAQKFLVEGLTPCIEFNVSKMLRRGRPRPAAGRDLHQEIQDLGQEAFLELIKDDFKVLRKWDPERLSLCAYAGSIAKIRTTGFLRTQHNPWTEEPNPGQDLDRNDPKATPEAVYK